ncbi:ATP synthase F1 subunit delta [Candidatus Xenohaliotis californiensis]
MFFNSTIIAYSEALYNHCVQYKNLKTAYSEMKNLEQIIDNNKDFIKFFNNPALAKPKKISMIIEIFSNNEKLQIESLLVNLINNNSINLINKIIEYFFIICAIKEGAIECCIITATKPLKKDLEHTSRLLENYLGKKIYLQSALLPSIIGGLIVRIKEKSIDLSYSRQIQHTLNIVSKHLKDKDLLNEIYN